MRPKVTFLDEDLKVKIIDEARHLLCTLGVEVHNPAVLGLLGDHGAEVDLAKQHVRLTDDLIDRSLSTVPSGFKLYDVAGRQTHDLSGDAVHFTPGSAAINILDDGTMRKPDTADYVTYAKLVSGLPYIEAQSTAFIPADVTLVFVTTSRSRLVKPCRCFNPWSLIRVESRCSSRRFDSPCRAFSPESLTLVSLR